MQYLEIKDLLKKRQLDDAEKAIQASDLAPAVSLPLRIELLFLRQKYGEALALAEQMIREDRDPAVAYRWKAEILDDGFHEYKKSIECSSRAIELDPGYAEAYIVRGNTKRWMKPADNEGAMDDYRSALKYDENDPHALSGIG